MKSRQILINDKLETYLMHVGVNEPEAMKQQRLETAHMPNAHIQISPLEAQFLTFLVSLIGAKKILEIGTFRGYSAMALAHGLQGQGKGKVVTCDIDKENPNIAQTYWQQGGFNDHIEFIVGPGLETMQQLKTQDEPFDLLFLDADKKALDDYYENALQLVRQGGLIIIDNALRRGDVADECIDNEGTVAIRTLNEKIARDKRVMHSLLTVDDGLMLVQKCG